MSKRVERTKMLKNPKNAPKELVDALTRSADIKEMSYQQISQVIAMALHANSMALGDMSEMLLRQNGGNEE